MSLNDLIQSFFWFSMLASVGVCIRFGGKPERLGMAIMLAGSVLSVLVTTAGEARFETVETGIWVVDGGVLIAFSCMALTSKRFWPLWVTSFQLNAVMTHLADYLMPMTHASAYSLMQGFYFYPMMSAILIGVYGYQKSLEMRTHA